VGLVEDEDGVLAVLAGAGGALALNGLEHAGGGGLVLDAEHVAELAVEVAAPEGHVREIVHAKVDRRELVFERSQDARLTHAGLADDERVLAVSHGLEEPVESRLAPTIHPQEPRVDALVEGAARQPESLLDVVTHGRSPAPWRAAPRWDRTVYRE